MPAQSHGQEYNAATPGGYQSQHRISAGLPNNDHVLHLGLFGPEVDGDPELQ